MCSCVGYAEIPSQETYRSHTVEKGETVYSIAQQYGVTEEAIYRLNPDAKNGISTSSVLILPAPGNELVVKEFKKHKVKRKETLYSISQQYGVSVDDIKKYNKHLYASELKKGEKIQIPVFEKKSILTDIKIEPIIDIIEEIELFHFVRLRPGHPATVSWLHPSYFPVACFS